MPASQRQPSIPLIGRLLDRPQQFEFFQALRVLEAWADQGDEADRSGARPIRFRSRVSMAFPTSDIESIKVERDAALEAPPYAYNGGNVHVTPSFMGLLGSTGTLPFGFTENMNSAPGPQQEDLREFFDIFAQRSFALFCEAWARARITYRFDEEGRNALLPSQLAIAGAGRLEKPESAIRDEVRAFYGGLLRSRAVSGTVLAQVLTDYFAVPIEVQPCVGEWSDLAPQEMTSLGVSGCQLGVNAVLGARTYQRDRRVRLRIGPLTLEQYAQFSPGAKGTRALAAMLSCFPVSHLQFEVNPVLRAEDVQPCVLLGSDPPSGGFGGLGLNMFFGGGPTRDRDDLLFDLPALNAFQQEA